jgi:hypothetical protein
MQNVVVAKERRKGHKQRFQIYLIFTSKKATCQKIYFLYRSTTTFASKEEVFAHAASNTANSRAGLLFLLSSRLMLGYREAIYLKASLSQGTCIT